jgi:3D (Asp-Asp-Asp) domain-containing protein
MRKLKGLLVFGALAMLSLSAGGWLSSQTLQAKSVESEVEGPTSQIHANDQIPPADDKIQSLYMKVDELSKTNDKQLEQIDYVNYLIYRSMNAKALASAEAPVRTAGKSAKVMIQQDVGSVITVEATAYIALCDTGCTGVTATGIDVRGNTPNIIAVDPDIIPLHRKVELLKDGKSLGVYDTQDTGGDIKGFRIDVLKATTGEATSFGRTGIQVKILN